MDEGIIFRYRPVTEVSVESETLVFTSRVMVTSVWCSLDHSPKFLPSVTRVEDGRRLKVVRFVE